MALTNSTGLQKIIDLAESIDINRRNVVGIQYSRNEIAKVSETPTRNPWRLTVTMKALLAYSECRGLLESIDDLDARLPQNVSFSINSDLSWIARYQAQDFGAMTVTLAQALTVVSFEGNQLVLGNLPATPTVNATTPIFKAGDFIQIGTGTLYPHPFTVVGDVLRGAGNTITVTTHRPNFLLGGAKFGLSGQTLTVGNNVYFRVFCPNMPTYKLMPGATQRNSAGVLTNNAYVEWGEDFKLFEWLGEQ